MPTRYEQELERLRHLPRAERFEALIEFPAQHTFKVIGRSEGFSLAVEGLLRASGHRDVLLIERPSSGGKYVSVTFSLGVESGAALDELYRTLEQLPGLRYLL
jgi:hypothetical protein